MTAFTSPLETCVPSAIASINWFLVILAMMDSFVEAQNSLERMSDGGGTLFKTRQSHAVCFSIISVVMKSPGLKPIGAQNARRSSAWVPYLATMRHERPFHNQYRDSWPDIGANEQGTGRKFDVRKLQKPLARRFLAT